jgi:hypothetical protein
MSKIKKCEKLTGEGLMSPKYDAGTGDVEPICLHTDGWPLLQPRGGGGAAPPPVQEEPRPCHAHQQQQQFLPFYLVHPAGLSACLPTGHCLFPFLLFCKYVESKGGGSKNAIDKDKKMGEGGVFRIPAHNSSLLFTFQIRIRAMQNPVSQGKEAKHVFV